VNLALIDFDGTITRGDTYRPFLRYVVRWPRLVLGVVPFMPVAVAYQLGLLSARQARPIASAFTFIGASADSVRDLGRRYAMEVLPRTIRPRALERIRWHQEQGDTVVVVSGSLDAYLAPWCDSIGVERICTELEERHGRLTGRYCQGDCSGPTKSRLIREHYDLSRYSVIYAYGDTEDDREMLELAHRRFYRWREVTRWSDAAAVGPGHSDRAET
jgi:HAD superfamily hydrolase (TIGR01490 family)